MRLFAGLLLLLSTALFAQDHRVETLAGGLHHPWGLAELPGGDLLVSERRGRLLRLTPDGGRHQVSGLPDIAAVGQGGLLDLALHPEFADNRWLYFSYSQPGPGGAGTAVARARLEADRLTRLQVLFEQRPKTTGGAHFGSRLVFDEQGYLFITTGDRYHSRDLAQRLDNHLGKILRLHDDGRVPADNPFVGQPGALPEIWSYGHRSPQGAALAPDGTFWMNEHGPRGGDEINRPEPGKNYGWPVITYGVNYSGTKVGEGITHKDGMEQPVHQWTPSIAVSGMAFITSDRYPGWQGQMVVGALKTKSLERITLDGDKVRKVEPLLPKLGQRVRDVRQGPDGWLYVLTDENKGQLLRLRTQP